MSIESLVSKDYLNYRQMGGQMTSEQIERAESIVPNLEHYELAQKELETLGIVGLDAEWARTYVKVCALNSNQGGISHLIESYRIESMRQMR